MKKGFISLLAKIGFRDAINKVAYEHQSKTYKDNLKYAFRDSLGRSYFYFPKMEDIPLPLFEKLNELQEQMRCKIPSKDLDIWIKKVKEVLNGNSKTKVTDFGYWLGVLEERRNILFEPMILTEIAALLYIREDENPCIYNEELHKEKFQMLWQDSREGAFLYDFFHNAGLSGYIPSESVTRENWIQFLEQASEKMMKFKSAITRISTLESEFKKLDNNS